VVFGDFFASGRRRLQGLFEEQPLTVILMSRPLLQRVLSASFEADTLPTRDLLVATRTLPVLVFTVKQLTSFFQQPRTGVEEAEELIGIISPLLNDETAPLLSPFLGSFAEWKRCSLYSGN